MLLITGILHSNAKDSARNHSEVVDPIKWFLERSNTCASVSIRGPYQRVASNGQKISGEDGVSATDGHGCTRIPIVQLIRGHYTSARNHSEVVDPIKWFL